MVGWSWLAHWVRFIADKVFELEPAEVVNLFAKRKTYNDEEIAELRALLAEDEKSRKE